MALAPDVLAALWEHARAHPQRIQSDGRLRVLEREMRALLTAPGTRSKFMTVLLGARTEQGDAIDAHAHPEHTLLWYAQDASLLVAGEEVKVRAGEVIHLAPGVEHAVPKVAAPRLSVAMLVPAQPGHRTFKADTLDLLPERVYRVEPE